MKSSTGTASAGLYVHIPFCLTKCPYCDFFSVTDLSLVDGFLEALDREAALYSPHSGPFETFDTLYIGGGTPTILSSAHMARLLSRLRSSFNFDPFCEVTVEANPDDVTIEKLQGLRAEGVNRLSIGVQSFRDKDLVFLKRRHSAKAARKAIESALEAGFENLSIDLIYALPGQPKRSWLACLEQATAYPITHLSCYELTIEERTPFGSMRKEGNLKAATEGKGRDLFLLTSEFLEDKGFVHYEISNHARVTQASCSFSSPSYPLYSKVAPGARVAVHNTKYWTHVPYLGLGPSAHSFGGKTRWWNFRSVNEYCESLLQGKRPTAGHEDLTADQLRLERLYLGFRTRMGVSRSDIEDSDNSGQTLLDLVEAGLLAIIEDRIVPTRKGLLIADHLPLMFA